MDEQSKAALELLVQNGYLETVKGKYRPTKKLNEVRDEALLLDTNGDVLKGTWEEIYTRFILECKIPRNGESGDGSMYALNKYSDDAMKKFREIIRSGIEYKLLVQVTQNYYAAGTVRYKKTISNYILEGLWRMDYLTLKDQSPEQRLKQLKQDVDAATTFTRDRIG